MYLLYRGHPLAWCATSVLQDASLTGNSYWADQSQSWVCCLLAVHDAFDPGSLRTAEGQARELLIRRFFPGMVAYLRRVFGGVCMRETPGDVVAAGITAFSECDGLGRLK